MRSVSPAFSPPHGSLGAIEGKGTGGVSCPALGEAGLDFYPHPNPSILQGLVWCPDLSALTPSKIFPSLCQNDSVTETVPGRIGAWCCPMLPHFIKTNKSRGFYAPDFLLEECDPRRQCRWDPAPLPFQIVPDVAPGQPRSL